MSKFYGGGGTWLPWSVFQKLAGSSGARRTVGKQFDTGFFDLQDAARKKGYEMVPMDIDDDKGYDPPNSPQTPFFTGPTAPTRMPSNPVIISDGRPRKRRRPEGEPIGVPMIWVPPTVGSKKRRRKRGKGGRKSKRFWKNSKKTMQGVRLVRAGKGNRSFRK